MEGREIALERYSRGFEEQLLGRPVYIDFARDLVHFDDDSNVMAFCCVDPVSFSFETRLFEGEHPNLVKLLPENPTSAEDNIRHLAIESAFLKDLVVALPRFGALESVILPKPDDDPVQRRISPAATAFAERKYTRERKEMEDGLRAEWDNIAKKRGNSFKPPVLEYLTPKEMRQRLGMTLRVRGLQLA